MKHYILLSVTAPDRDDDIAYSKFLSLANKLEAIGKTTKGIEQLAANVWLLPRDQGMPFVAECMALASRSNLQARPRFLNSDE